MVVREPAVAGRFYPANPRELTREVDEYLSREQRAAKLRALGCVVPHAGIMYSGHVAGAVYSSIHIPARMIILCPRHFPPGQPMAINSAGVWRTPLGDASIDSELAEELKRECPLLREDTVAHRSEHSLEVQLPFLQRAVHDFRFVPIALGTDRFQAFDELGRAVAQVIQRMGGSILVVASSDMNHHETDSVTRVKDQKAIERLLALDPRGLYDTVRREGITMCGYGPAVTMLTASKELGATRAQLIRYATSGDVTGDRDYVVGYAGIVVM